MDIYEDLLRERRTILERLNKLETTVDSALSQGAKHDVAPASGGGKKAVRRGIESDENFDNIIGDAKTLVSNIDVLKGEERSILKEIDRVTKDQADIRRANKELVIAVVVVLLATAALALGVL